MFAYERVDCSSFDIVVLQWNRRGEKDLKGKQKLGYERTQRENKKHNQRTSETLTNLPVRRKHSLQNKEERYTKTVTLQQLPTKGENVHCKKYQTLFICNIYLINMGKNSIKVRRLQFS